jgi:hypothetical protein
MTRKLANTAGARRKPRESQLAILHKILNRDQRTLEAIFRHPTAHNIAWSDATHLIDRLGNVHQEANGRVLFAIGEHRHVFHEPHIKELTQEQVAQLRGFLESAGVTPRSVTVVEENGAPESPTFDVVVAIDHHQTRLFAIQGESETERTLRPYDPYHFLHHLSHRQDRELRGQREPEEPSYYAQIAAGLVPARRVVILGHGSGHSDAAAHLKEVLRAKHPEIFKRVVAAAAVDLSALTEPQLLALALRMLDSPTRADH